MKYLLVCLISLQVIGCATTQDVQRLQTQVNALNSQVNSLKDEISYIKRSADLMESTIESINASIAKLSVNQQFAVPQSTAVHSVKPPDIAPSTSTSNEGRKIYTGPRGETYYFNSEGKKVYIKH